MGVRVRRLRLAAVQMVPAQASGLCHVGTRNSTELVLFSVRVVVIPRRVSLDGRVFAAELTKSLLRLRGRSCHAGTGR